MLLHLLTTKLLDLGCSCCDVVALAVKAALSKLLYHLRNKLTNYKCKNMFYTALTDRMKESVYEIFVHQFKRRF